MAREIGPMIAIFSETKPACYFFFGGFLTTPLNNWRRLAKECALKAVGLQRVRFPPGNWFAPPRGNRSLLFLSNEKHSFLGISLRGGRHQFLCWGER
jgi:hypothetical protein